MAARSGQDLREFGLAAPVSNFSMHELSDPSVSEKFQRVATLHEADRLVDYNIAYLVGCAVTFEEFRPLLVSQENISDLPDSNPRARADEVFESHRVDYDPKSQKSPDGIVGSPADHLVVKKRPFVEVQFLLASRSVMICLL
jgi:hypothetical protein